MGQSDSRPQIDLNNLNAEVETELHLALRKIEVEERARREVERNRQIRIDEQLAACLAASSSLSSLLDEQGVARRLREEIPVATRNDNSDLNVEVTKSKSDQQTVVSRSTNLYVSNLDGMINNERLRKEFSRFGDITSAKVMMEDSRSKGFGFVCFLKPEAAANAIAAMNGQILGSKTLYVTLAENRNQMLNVYVNNLDDTIDDNRLREEFSLFGRITSAKVMMQGNKSKGFGFVCFTSPVEAIRAITKMNGRGLGSKVLYVTLAKNKNQTEQIADSMSPHANVAEKKSQRTNLYVKNLVYTIDDEKLRELFSPFGRITSAKVMTENGRSKGFGFVCFSSPDEATRAIAEMNRFVLGSKFLYVSLAEHKEDRRTRLTRLNQPLQSGHIITNQRFTTENSARGGTRCTAASEDDPEKLSCKICLDKDFSHILDCRHVLCKPCADTVFNSHHQCPFCRKAITSPPKPIHF